MKNLITATACVMVLLAFLSQFVQQQYCFMQLATLEAALSSFETQVQEQQKITTKSKQWIRGQAADILQCQQKDIEVKEIKTKEKHVICYELRGPKLDYFASADFWLIDESKLPDSFVLQRKVLVGEGAK